MAQCEVQKWLFIAVFARLRWSLWTHKTATLKHDFIYTTYLNLLYKLMQGWLCFFNCLPRLCLWCFSGLVATTAMWASKAYIGKSHYKGRRASALCSGNSGPSRTAQCKSCEECSYSMEAWFIKALWCHCWQCCQYPEGYDGRPVLEMSRLLRAHSQLVCESMTQVVSSWNSCGKLVSSDHTLS